MMRRAFPKGRRLHATRGFILLETLIAFAILAVMLAAAYRITGSGAATLARAEAAALVLDQAQSELDELLAGPPLTPGTETTAFAGEFTRVRTIRQVRAARQGGGQTILYRINIAIYRKDDINLARPVLHLETLRVERGRSGS
ncbi:pilin/secretion family protein with methylation motif [Breoghania corrubedonensis]|uniref:Pilin/secretion family protein with methylation motif n=1 Tax=Breoghania corrubedonensis TaxID=665038 RepID=A0A2T5VBC1_9HYPH|nr:prepilin-type N-terminal cleavage/methylation domain-containing protein [Breoghania corrubedonensis]PTW61053.1 pilin/secretion family protein with methylation motif [Breoghania corrubedonensis]